MYLGESDVQHGYTKCFNEFCFIIFLLEAKVLEAIVYVTTEAACSLSLVLSLEFQACR